MTTTQTVHANRTFVTRDGEVAPALTAEGWAAFLAKVAAAGLTAQPFTTAEGAEGVTVECATQRGTTGAYNVHAWACAYGALAVVR